MSAENTRSESELAQIVTQLHEAQKSVKETKERMELALWGADLGTWDWNVRTGELRLNERWAGMLGYALNEIEPHQRIWEKLVHPDDMPGAKAVLN